MGKRKRERALKIKKKNNKKYISIFKKILISPKKIRNLINLIKGKYVLNAIEILKNYVSFKKSRILLKIILYIISIYKNRTKDNNINNLYIYRLEVNKSKYIRKLKYLSKGNINLIKRKLSIIKIEIKVKK
ncbi:MAG: hypothetical protein RDO_0300 [Flavobacteriales endosymbiont of Rhyzopertha dominica]|nr:MAG: uL22 family ribosomal protein [Candidatus Shikimatogenerans bostrichidophilus]